MEEVNPFLLSPPHSTASVAPAPLACYLLDVLRDPSLIPLSHQHHNGLALCVLTDRALQQDDTSANIQKLAQRIVDRYEIEIINHFEIEERVLFPEVRKLEGDWSILDELISEHRRLGALVETLRTAPTREFLEQFAQLLRSHIRREENELFQSIQAQMPADILKALGVRIDAQAVRVCL
jgi:hemerythrin-like domain-containing protein